MPTFSLISQPQQLSPVNAPLWFVGSSTNNQFPFFKYDFKLYKYNRYNLSNKTFLGQFKIPPRPITNYGVFDVHKILQSQVGSYNFDFTQTGIIPVTDDRAVVLYKGVFGFEYNPNFKILSTALYNYGTNVPNLQYGSETTIIFLSNGNTTLAIYYDDQIYSYCSYNPTNGSAIYISIDGQTPNKITSINNPNSGGYFNIHSDLIFPILVAGSSHTFTFFYTDNNNYLRIYLQGLNLLQNDLVTLLMDNPNLNSSYNGQSVILTDLGDNSYVTNILYGTVPSSPPETGVVNLLQRNTSATNYGYSYPGTRQYIENNVNFGITKELSNSNFCTNYTAIKHLYINQYETLSIMSILNSNSNDNISYSYYKVITYDQNMNIINTYNSINPISSLGPNGILDLSIKFELPTGTKNLQGWTMSGTPIDFSNVTYYKVGLVNTSINISALFTYKIAVNCSVFPNVRLMFMNRNGGYDYWNFNYDSKYTLDIKRTLYTKQLDYNYNIGDRGRTILNQEASIMYVCNTDWINEYDYNYLQELFTSPDVFVIDEITNNKLPINIEDTQFIQKTQFSDKMFNLTLSYRFSFDINLQGG